MISIRSRLIVADFRVEVCVSTWINRGGNLGNSEMRSNRSISGNENNSRNAVSLLGLCINRSWSGFWKERLFGSCNAVEESSTGHIQVNILMFEFCCCDFEVSWSCRQYWQVFGLDLWSTKISRGLNTDCCFATNSRQLARILWSITNCHGKVTNLTNRYFCQGQNCSSFNIF